MLSSSVIGPDWMAACDLVPLNRDQRVLGVDAGAVFIC